MQKRGVGGEHLSTCYVGVELKVEGGGGGRKSVYQSRRISNRREKCIVNKYVGRE